MISLDAMPVPMSTGGYSWIDLIDLAWATSVNWQGLASKRSRTTYPTTGSHGRTLYMHKEIARRAGVEALTIDHIDGNGLNNTRVNLRPANRSQQQGNRGLLSTNTSGYRGVRWWVPAKGTKGRGWWVATFYVGSKKKHIGNFDTAEAAARVYDEWAKAKWGTYARLNFQGAS